jgi:hypothetical protein
MKEEQHDKVKQLIVHVNHNKGEREEKREPNGSAQHISLRV